MIEIGSGIDQHRLSVDVQPDGEGVGVAMGRDREIAERAVIEDQQRFAAVDLATEDGVAACIKMPCAFERLAAGRRGAEEKIAQLGPRHRRGDGFVFRQRGQIRQDSAHIASSPAPGRSG